jgi:hypothetical protein
LYFNGPEYLSLGIQGFFLKRKSQEPERFKAFSNFFNTLSDWLAVMALSFLFFEREVGAFTTF